MIEGCTAPRLSAMKTMMIINVLILTRSSFTGTPPTSYHSMTGRNDRCQRTMPMNHIQSTPPV